ncbi:MULTISPECIES: peptidoglycan DD-metalloendopeptidase family protein [Acinetobacter]|mgnify:FL=1|uniref:Peptidoglycan DD-metalloendopeptidase family protein n=2 Tax=Gammaproteobacteria TaxID=1236 RepID=A0AAP9GW40_9GAMM|nr:MULTISPECIES: peptidoglycan DD-metalloendopeptidase family protein [Acinetobacter]MCA4813541.1 peptidoglycan DD-metalloendopeptidase family protein [Acinetobacter towneri]MCO8053148.1 peptidoglycan DD-metalloendopeptidase family protein [Acinetobacter towneri]MCO8058961.1 peptidoglycan DD-metalloendopeptidase family protein [Acinetobacter towneri]MCO8064805.1 peptidoglycan DD-metalloendopeptidase family protein [Acinetobacter towneri]MDD4851897.1 peptidoglycan DD-metalloendopeptidase family
MPVVFQYRLFSTPTALLKTLVLSSAVVATVVLSGCASKPQVNNSARYATAPNFYTVRSGDTLSGIAARYGLSYLSIAEMNDIAPPYRIYVGQSIRLKAGNAPRTTSTRPVTQAAPIQRQTVTLPTTPVTPAPVTSTTTTTTSSTTPSTPVRSSTLRWVKPSQGAVIAQFNLASNIKGIRYGGNVGDPIYAAADGQVVYAADGLKEYGNLILIKHIDGYITAYAHNSKMNVSSGQNVTAGQKIAEMGSSGATRTMLEFQVRLDGKPINPTNVLPIN